MICPNCGRETTGKFCPGCGTKLNVEAEAPAVNDTAPQNPAPAEPVAPQTSAPPYAANQNRNYPPNQNYGSPGRQVVGDYRDIPSEMAGQAPGSQILRQVVGSPLILISAILVTLFAGAVCYACGKVILETFDLIVWIFKSGWILDEFDILAITVFVGDVVHLLMAVWMMISVWVLYGSAAGKRKPVMSLGGLKACLVYVRVSMVVFAILALAALLALVAQVVKENPDSKFYFELYSLTNVGLYQTGTIYFTTFFDDAVLQLASASVIFIVAAIQNFLLFSVFESSELMLRCGGFVQKRVLPAAVLTLAAGLVLLGSNICLLVKYAEYSELNAILLLAGFLALGLASVLCSIALFMDSARFKRIQVQ